MPVSVLYISSMPFWRLARFDVVDSPAWLCWDSFTSVGALAFLSCEVLRELNAFFARDFREGLDSSSRLSASEAENWLDNFLSSEFPLKTRGNGVGDPSETSVMRAVIASGKKTDSESNGSGINAGNIDVYSIALSSALCVRSDSAQLPSLEASLEAGKLDPYSSEEDSYF